MRFGPVKNSPLMYVFSFPTLANISVLSSTPRKLDGAAVFTPPPPPAFKAASLQSVNTAAENKIVPRRAAGSRDQTRLAVRSPTPSPRKLLAGR